MKSRSNDIANATCKASQLDLVQGESREKQTACKNETWTHRCCLYAQAGEHTPRWVHHQERTHPRRNNIHPRTRQQRMRGVCLEASERQPTECRPGTRGSTEQTACSQEEETVHWPYKAMVLRKLAGGGLRRAHQVNLLGTLITQEVEGESARQRHPSKSFFCKQILKWRTNLTMAARGCHAQLDTASEATK